MSLLSSKEAASMKAIMTGRRQILTTSRESVRKKRPV